MDNFAAKVYIDPANPFQLYGTDKAETKLIAPADLVFSRPGGNLAGRKVFDAVDDRSVGTVDPYSLVSPGSLGFPLPFITIAPTNDVDLSRIPSGFNNPVRVGGDSGPLAESGDFDDIEVIFGRRTSYFDSRVTTDFDLTLIKIPYPQFGDQTDRLFYSATFGTSLSDTLHGARVYLRKNGSRVALLGMLARTEVDGANQVFIAPAHLAP